MEGYIPSLPEEPYVNFTQNNVSDLTTIWEHTDQAAKESFCRKYGDVAALIAVVINELLLGAAVTPQIRDVTGQRQTYTYASEALTY